jgi:hypothetical protein
VCWSRSTRQPLARNGRITPDEYRFVEFFRETSNARGSAIRAGVPAAKASRWAGELLKRDDVQELIMSGASAFVDDTDTTVSKEEVIQQLKSLDQRAAALGDNAKGLELRYKIWSKLGEVLGMFKHSSTSEVDVNVSLISEVKARLREQHQPALPPATIEAEVLSSPGVIVAPEGGESRLTAAVQESSDREPVQSSTPAPSPSRNDYTTPMQEDWVEQRLKVYGER